MDGDDYLEEEVEEDQEEDQEDFTEKSNNLESINQNVTDS